MQSHYIHGDSLLEIPKLQDDHFQLILADPPYVISRPNNFTTLGRAGIDFGEWDHTFDQYSWIKLSLPKLKRGGSLIIFNDWKKLGNIAEYCESLGLIVKRFLTWVKPNPLPANPTRTFLQGTEHAIWLTKGKNWVFNHKYHRGYFDYPVPQTKKDENGNKILRHPNQKPFGLYSELIQVLTNEGDFVLDPFCGAGTTGKVCETLNRKFICIEKEEKYFKLATISSSEAT